MCVFSQLNANHYKLEKWILFETQLSRHRNKCLYWNGQLVCTPALGLYLCVFLCVDTRHTERRVT